MERIKPPTKAEFEREKLNILKRFAPDIYECLKCGWPVVDGFCCGYCGDSAPYQEEKESE